MQSTRDHEQSLSREICIAFFEEYLIHRDTYWNSYWQQILSKIINRPKERQTICKEFIDRIKTANSLDEKEAIIRDLGIEARSAQGEKIQSDNQSYFAFAWNKFLGLFVKDNSLFAKTCHTVRTRMVADILLSKDRNEHLEKAKQLHAELDKKNSLIDYNDDHKLDASKLQDERDNLYYQLLDMHDKLALKDAMRWRKFPNSLPSHDATTLKLPPSVKPNPNAPLIYDINYGAIFFENEIKSVPKREHDFNAQLKIAVEQAHNLNSGNILSASYFVPIDFEQQVIQEEIKDSTTKEELEKRNKTLIETDSNLTEERAKETSNTSPKVPVKILTGNPSVMYQTKKEEDAKKEEPHNKKQSKHMRTPSNS